MKKLETQFRKGGFDYTQIKREGMVAIFRQVKPGFDTSNLEVVRIQSHNGYEMMGQWVPPSEFMPKDTDRGTHGFTFRGEDLDKAEAKFQELLAAQENPKPKITLKLKTK